MERARVNQYGTTSRTTFVFSAASRPRSARAHNVSRARIAGAAGVHRSSFSHTTDGSLTVTAMFRNGPQRMQKKTSETSAYLVFPRETQTLHLDRSNTQDPVMEVYSGRRFSLLTIAFLCSTTKRGDGEPVAS